MSPTATAQGEVDDLQHLAPDIAERLVVRLEDSSHHVEQEIKHYREHMLRPLEVNSVHVSNTCM